MTGYFFTIIIITILLFILYLAVFDDGTITAKFIIYFKQLEKNFNKQIDKVELPFYIEDRLLPPNVSIPIPTYGGRKSAFSLTFPRIKEIKFGNLKIRLTPKQQKIFAISLSVLPLIGGLSYQYARVYLGFSSNLTPPPVRRVDLKKIYKKLLDDYSDSLDSK